MGNGEQSQRAERTVGGRERERDRERERKKKAHEGGKSGGAERMEQSGANGAKWNERATTGSESKGKAREIKHNKC